MKLRKRYLVLGVAGTVLVVAGALVAALAWLAGSTRGSAWAVEQALALAGPGYAVGRVSGRLADTLVLEGVHVAQDGLVIDLEQLELAWRPQALLAGRVRVTRLAARGVAATLPPSGDAAASTSAPPAYPELPLRIVVDAVAVDDLSLTQGDSVTTLRHIGFGLRAGPAGAELQDLVVDSDDFALAGRAGVRPGAVPGITAALNLHLPRQTPPLDLALTAAGALDALALELAVSGPAVVHVAGSADVIATPPAFDLDATLDALALDAGSGDHVGPARVRLSGTTQAISLHGESPLSLAAVGSRQIQLDSAIEAGDDGHWRGHFGWQVEAAEDLPWPALSGSGEVDYGDDRVVLRHTSAAPLTSTLSATLDGLAANGRLEAELALDALDLPPGATSQVHLAHLRLDAHGALDDLALDLQAQGRDVARGPFTLAAQGRLGAEVFDLATLRAELLGGSVTASGRVGFGEAPTATLDIGADQLDLARADPRLAGTLALRGALDARLVDGQPFGRLSLAEVSGDWRGYRLDARAEVARDAQGIELQTLHAALGDNVLEASGTLAARLDGRFSLEAPDLAQLDLGVRGHVRAHGTLAGTPAAPAVNADVDGGGLRYQDLRVAGIEASVALDLGAEDTAQRVAARLSGLASGDEVLGNLAIDLDGALASHRLVAHLDGGARTARVAAQGSWRDDAWHGTLDALDLGLGSFGAWSLAAPVAVAWSPAALELARACLVAGSAQVCAAAPHWGAGTGDAALEIEALPLDLAADYLPTTVVVSGTLGGRADVEQRDGALRATAALAVHGGAFDVTLDDGDTEHVPIPALNADLVLDDTHLEVVTAGQVGDWVELDAGFGYALDGDHALDGKLHLAAGQLDWLEQFVPDLAGSQGRAVVDAKVGGTRGAPRVDASVRLEEGALRVQASGMQVSVLDLDLDTPDGRSIDLAGRIGNADGAFVLDGHAARSDDAAWHGRLGIKGDAVGAVRLPEVEADVSPDLVLSVDGQYADIRGTIALPRVHVDLRHLPDSAIEVSPDEVVTGEGGDDDSARAPSFFVDQVTGDVEAVVGDDVWIAAAGLKARLGGSLRWTKARGDGIGRGEGRVSIVEGGYKAYGQDLAIERGHLTFAGPIDNPALDVRAVRPNLDVVAGVLVSGDVRAPRFDLFSEPAMPDSEVLSYIITGQGLDEASSGESQMIARAALSLGAERSSMVTSQIADAFGLDEFSVNAGTTARETSLTAGKRLGPKLSVRSEFNPFDRLWSFFLNYKLTSHWSVEAESGVRQGADVLYSIEREELLPEHLLEPSHWFDDAP